MKDLLPALNLPTPLIIDFDFELGRSDNIGTNKPRSPRTPTFDGTTVASTSNDSFDASEYFEIPTIMLNDETIASLVGPSCLFTTSETSTSTGSLTGSITPPPAKPLDWIWICHLCHSRYPLGATRRCLIDGHYYCSGESSITQRNVKRRKRAASCSSEFDYIGWKDWGVWRRSLVASQERYLDGHDKSPYKLKGCENCEYPSECRYDKLKRAADKCTNSCYDAVGSPTKPTACKEIETQDEDVEMSGMSDIPAKTVSSHEQSTTTTTSSHVEGSRALTTVASEPGKSGVVVNDDKLSIILTGILVPGSHKVNRTHSIVVCDNHPASCSEAIETTVNPQHLTGKFTEMFDQIPGVPLSRKGSRTEVSTSSRKKDTNGATQSETTNPIPKDPVKFDPKRYYSTLDTQASTTTEATHARSPRSAEKNKSSRSRSRSRSSSTSRISPPTHQHEPEVKISSSKNTNTVKPRDSSSQTQNMIRELFGLTRQAGRGGDGTG